MTTIVDTPAGATSKTAADVAALRETLRGPLELTDAIIDDFVAGVAERPSKQTLASVWYFGRVVRDVRADATAFGDRSQPWLLSFDSIWASPEDDTANISWAREQ